MKYDPVKQGTREEEGETRRYPNRCHLTRCERTPRGRPRRRSGSPGPLRPSAQTSQMLAESNRDHQGLVYIRQKFERFRASNCLHWGVKEWNPLAECVTW